jgi:hypothetical protein
MLSLESGLCALLVIYVISIVAVAYKTRNPPPRSSGSFKRGVIINLLITLVFGITVSVLILQSQDLPIQRKLALAVIITGGMLFLVILEGLATWMQRPQSLKRRQRWQDRQLHRYPGPPEYLDADLSNQEPHETE